MVSLKSDIFLNFSNFSTVRCWPNEKIPTVCELAILYQQKFRFCQNEETRCTYNLSFIPSGEFLNTRISPNHQIPFGKWNHAVISKSRQLDEVLVVNPFLNSSYQNITILICHILVTRIYVQYSRLLPSVTYLKE